MVDVHYHIVQHDGGWAYKVNDVYSETFTSHEAALRAAKDASERQAVAGETAAIRYQDSTGFWHEELAGGTDRPHADVVDDDEDDAGRAASA
ncbi:DUF2188 domain-containing protein [Aurantimonas sp. MSK8Z-1]|uniref:DUF2188 domain-containing protein n=1 Tax=Mangrovibrevibacter kandeliae TaxID=2968473 RepID=UPI002118C0EE|nr:DUF2188 domain-containing protein [Aurantimonas sp. MSK8Z-1]MCW4116047.1 DUF2188 domain-containing protein [Aurantimonas sp. MSK8Z-1]